MDQRDVYQYSRITSQGTIRLILLQPSPDLGAAVECSLIEVSLEDCDHDITEHYVALSYVWGDANDKQVILVDGKGLVITASLDYALRHIRDSHRVLRAWADGICINQNNNEDRSQQVRLMDSIYSTARHTIVFLGPSSIECDSIMNLLSFQKPNRMRNQRKVNSATEKRHMDQFEAMVEDHILTKPWFSRVWVLQELVFSADPWIQIGKQRVRWNLFCSHVLLSNSLSWRPNSRQLLIGMDNARAQFENSYNETRQREKVLDRLFDLLNARRGSGVSDPRDMIYAHLGLTDSSTQDLIPVDYDVSVTQLYEYVAHQHLICKQDTSILSYVEETELCDRREGLPSWVPDWTLVGPMDQDSTHLDIKPTNFSISVPGVLGVLGFDCGYIKAIIPESSWPKINDFGNLANDEALLRWLKSGPQARKVLRLVFDLYQATHRQIEEIATEKYETLQSSSRSWRNQQQLDVVLYYYILKIISTWLPVTSLEATLPLVGAARQDRTGTLVQVLVHNVYALIQCYKRRKRVALLEGGQLVQVPELARVGDIVASTLLMGRYYILRPHTGSVDPESEMTTRKDFEQILCSNGKPKEIAVRNGLMHQTHQYYASTSTVKHCKYIVWGDDMYGDLRSSTGVETMALSDYGIKFLPGNQQPIIFALH